MSSGFRTSRLATPMNGVRLLRQAVGAGGEGVRPDRRSPLGALGQTLFLPPRRTTTVAFAYQVPSRWSEAKCAAGGMFVDRALNVRRHPSRTIQR